MPQEHPHLDKHGFRLRGTVPSRLDSFSDVVFGFALTILVVSQGSPHTYAELHELLLAFLPFATCFALFIAVWLSHFHFFRRYGLQDGVTIRINTLLLLTVLFYVYPLKFLFTFGTGHAPPGTFTSPNQQRDLIIIYGAGIAAIFLCMAALHANAWRQRQHLRLNPLEETLTASSFWNYIGNGVIALLCCAFIYLSHLRNLRASYSFLLLVVWGRAHAILSRRYLRAARDRTSPQDRVALPHAI